MGFPAEDLTTPSSLSAYLTWLKKSCQPNFWKVECNFILFFSYKLCDDTVVCCGNVFLLGKTKSTSMSFITSVKKFLSNTVYSIGTKYACVWARQKWVFLKKLAKLFAFRIRMVEIWGIPEYV